MRMLRKIGLAIASGVLACAVAAAAPLQMISGPRLFQASYTQTLYERVEVASDTFDSSIDASWNNGLSGGHLATWVTGGHVRPTSTSEGGYLSRNTGTYDRSQYSRVTVQALSAGGNEIHAGVLGNTTDFAKYDCLLIGNSGDVKYAIFKAAAGGSGAILVQSDDIPGEAGSAGWTVTCENIEMPDGSNRIRMYTDEGIGDVLRLEVTDTGAIGGAVITSGRPMAGVYAPSSTTASQITAWSGGNLTPSPGVGGVTGTGGTVTRLFTDDASGTDPSTLWTISDDLDSMLDTPGGEYVTWKGFDAHLIDLHFTTAGVTFRNEVTTKSQGAWNGRTSFDEEYWYGVSIALPDASDPNGYPEWITSAPDSFYEIVAQWHDSAPRTAGYSANPIATLTVDYPSGASARWRFLARGYGGGAGGPSGFSSTGSVDLGPWDADLGKMVRFVFRMGFRWSTQTGYVEVWKDGVKVVSQFGMYLGYYQENGYAPYWKAGLYSGWASGSANPMGPTRRTHLKADYRMSRVVGNPAEPVGTDNNGYIDMMTGGVMGP